MNAVTDTRTGKVKRSGFAMRYTDRERPLVCYRQFTPPAQNATGMADTLHAAPVLVRRLR